MGIKCANPQCNRELSGMQLRWCSDSCRLQAVRHAGPGQLRVARLLLATHYWEVAQYGSRGATPCE